MLEPAGDFGFAAESDFVLGSKLAAIADALEGNGPAQFEVVSDLLFAESAVGVQFAERKPGGP
jgi:hypothetical protein